MALEGSKKEKRKRGKIDKEETAIQAQQIVRDKETEITDNLNISDNDEDESDSDSSVYSDLNEEGNQPSLEMLFV